jgi:hypothetical protein
MSDVVLDEGTEQVTVVCDNLNIQGHDFLLDSSERRRPNSPTFRRALVHDQNDGLTLNFGHDYPGGVTINNVQALDLTGDLQFRILSFSQVFHPGEPPQPALEKVSLVDVIITLRKEIADLQAQVAQLAAKP